MRLFCVFIFSANFIFGQVWTQLQDLPGTERDDGVAAIVNDKGYFGTGFKGGGFGLGSDFYSLDLSTNTWNTITSMPNGSERQYAVAFTYSNYFFVQGGLATGDVFLNDTYRYDVSLNTWSVMAAKPGTAVMAAACFTLNDKAYIIGGRFGNDQQVSNEVWEYNMSNNSWIQKNNFPFTARWRASAATYSNNGYLVFGKDLNGAFRKEIYRYNASTDSWIKIGDFPQLMGRHYVAMQGRGTGLVLFGGIDSLNNMFKDTWFFDETNGFVQGPDLPAAQRKGGMSCSNANKFYYNSGYTTSGKVKETWMLDILAGLNEIKSSSAEFKTWPNPVTAVMNYELKNEDAAANVIIQLGDIYGRTLVSWEYKEGKDGLDLGELEPGIYFLKVLSEGRILATKKIIKD